VPCSAALNGDTPAFKCRSTFRTTMMASSTTRPMASTSASTQQIDRVSERRHQKKAPTSDSGMATTGMTNCPQSAQEQGDHGGDNDQCLNQVLMTSLIKYLMNLVRRRHL